MTFVFDRYGVFACRFELVARYGKALVNDFRTAVDVGYFKRQTARKEGFADLVFEYRRRAGDFDFLDFGHYDADVERGGKTFVGDLYGTIAFAEFGLGVIVTRSYLFLRTVRPKQRESHSRRIELLADDVIRLVRSDRYGYTLLFDGFAEYGRFRAHSGFGVEKFLPIGYERGTLRDRYVVVYAACLAHLGLIRVPKRFVARFQGFHVGFRGDFFE